MDTFSSDQCRVNYRPILMLRMSVYNGLLFNHWIYIIERFYCLRWHLSTMENSFRWVGFNCPLLFSSLDVHYRQVDFWHSNSCQTDNFICSTIGVNWTMLRNVHKNWYGCMDRLMDGQGPHSGGIIRHCHLRYKLGTLPSTWTFCRILTFTKVKKRKSHCYLWTEYFNNRWSIPR